MPVGLFSVTSSAPWDPITHFGSDLARWWDTVDTSTITTSGGLCTVWASKVGSFNATPAAAGPAYSATARNGLPGLTFAASESMIFSATGLPTSTDSTIIAVGYMNNSAAYKCIGGYGGGFGNGDSRSIMSPSTGNKVGASISGYDPANANYAWDGLDRIVMMGFDASHSVILPCVDGNIDAAFMYSTTMATLTNNGRIGRTPGATSPWNGVIQCFMIINRLLTQLEKDKLSSYLAYRYGLQASLPASHPYKNVAPNVRATLSSDTMTGYSSVWSDAFTSLSLRTGNRYINSSSGYTTGKGVWADAGLDYMTGVEGYSDFGHGFFINHANNWQAIDPSFPPYGMCDITEDGALIEGSEGYPLIRTNLGATKPFLANLLMSGYAAKIKPPYARRCIFKVNTMGVYDFDAVWSLGESYAGESAATGYYHNEIDDYEWFGNSYSENVSAMNTHIDPNGSGIVSSGSVFNTGQTLRNTTIETVIVHHTDYIYGYTNGVLCMKAPVPANNNLNDLHHIVLNMAVGLSWEAYPGAITASISGDTMTVTGVGPRSANPCAVGKIITGTGVTANTAIVALGTGTGGAGTYTLNNSMTVASSTLKVSPVLGLPPLMTVRSVEYLAPASNTSGVFPSVPQVVPVLTWGGSFAGGVIPAATANGTTVATLSGATTYTLKDKNGATPSGLVVSGSNVNTSGTLVAGTYLIHVEGFNATGWPGLAPRKTVTVTASATTFNPSDVSASGGGLSGGNLTITNPNVSAWYGARSARPIVGINKTYMEFTVSCIVGNTAIGLCTSALNLDSAGLSGPGDSMVYYWHGETYATTGPSTSGMSASLSDGTVICVAVDRGARKAWWRVGSGSWNPGMGGTQNPATASGGFDLWTFANVYPFVVIYGGAVGNTATANFGATAFTHTAPSGFTGL